MVTLIGRASSESIAILPSTDECEVSSSAGKEGII